uniref:Uncharacterized protein n=1 Tax=Candidatus Kentrum sp. FM TaxID=2126340 RepID=A0A450SZ79_9GAMM|nr:MAG: hypothetical protein BECKFM1743A_GA0114220_102201 [Candidatus Kentron sp. FM]VFJ59574.1 MAG: hypothetical protein BECKFM1743C_GA0114222_102492 [Candidatus Kentron sp. FM]VFK17740.1 MAG: hypothetical protein BECKFM1743B_GA0114221_105001 [Candidatus Kentron sp. FM]
MSILSAYRKPTLTLPSRVEGCNPVQVFSARSHLALPSEPARNHTLVHTRRRIASL